MRRFLTGLIWLHAATLLLMAINEAFIAAHGSIKANLLFLAANLLGGLGFVVCIAISPVMTGLFVRRALRQRRFAWSAAIIAADLAKYGLFYVYWRQDLWLFVPALIIGAAQFWVLRRFEDKPA